MEKFGIFELLDALSALVLPQGPNTDESVRPEKSDPVYAPPDYESQKPQASDKADPPENNPANENPTATAATGQEQDSAALDAFLQRHDALSRKIRNRR